jgi:hypothetical protein
MKIEIRMVDNGFITQLGGDIRNRQVKSKEKVAGSIVELTGVIVEHLRAVYGDKWDS